MTTAFGFTTLGNKSGCILNTTKYALLNSVSNVDIGLRIEFYEKAERTSHLKIKAE